VDFILATLWDIRTLCPKVEIAILIAKLRLEFLKLGFFKLNKSMVTDLFIHVSDFTHIELTETQKERVTEMSDHLKTLSYACASMAAYFYFRSSEFYRYEDKELFIEILNNLGMNGKEISGIANYIVKICFAPFGN